MNNSIPAVDKARETSINAVYIDCLEILPVDEITDN